MKRKHPPQTRTLKLKPETVRRLNADDLTNVAAGCDTTSWTTERPNSGAACA